MAFLRFLDLFWVAPMVQGKEAYASMDFLQEEFWICLRKFPKTEEEKKIYVKDRVSAFVISHQFKTKNSKFRNFIILFLISLFMRLFRISSVPGS